MAGRGRWRLHKVTASDIGATLAVGFNLTSVPRVMYSGMASRKDQAPR